MITKSFTAPIGAGLVTRFVAPAANSAMSGRPGRTLVLTIHPALHAQWKRSLPHAEYMTARQWLRSGSGDAGDLIILDEHYPDEFRHVISTLERSPADVWLVKPNGPFRMKDGTIQAAALPSPVLALE